MYKLLICSTLLAISGIIGCSKEAEEVELTAESFAGLDASKVREVVITSCMSRDRHGRIWLHHTDFPVSDPEKIRIIVECIRDAKQGNYDMGPPARSIHFNTRKTLYWTSISWDDECVYGKWWQSAELLRYFKQWEFLPPPQTDPNA